VKKDHDHEFYSRDFGRFGRHWWHVRGDDDYVLTDISLRHID